MQSEPKRMLVMKDPFESYRIHKTDLPDLPFRMLIIGKSWCAGKTNTLVNLLLRPMDEHDYVGMQYYRHDFKGANIYIFSPSAKVDHKLKKLIEYKEIPAENIFHEYSEGALEHVYSKIQSQYDESMANDENPEHSLVVLDDCSYDGSLKNRVNGAITKLFCNGRHYLISTILTAQKYSDVLTTCRENYTCMILFECSDKQLDLIYDDVGMSNKVEFKKMFRAATKEPHSFMVVNAKCPPEGRYQDMSFKPLAR